MADRINPAEVLLAAGISNAAIQNVTRRLIEIVEREVDTRLPTLFVGNEELTKKYTGMSEEERLEFKRLLMAGFMRMAHDRIFEIGQSGSKPS